MKETAQSSPAALESLRRRAPLMTAAIYVAISLAWIFLSDPLLVRLLGGERQLAIASVVKGTVWVTVSALVLYLLVFRHVRRLSAMEEEARRRLLEGEQAAESGTVEWRAGSDTVSWSAGVYRIFGLQPGAHEPLLETMLGLVAPEDRPRIPDALGAAAEGGLPEPFELRIRRADGEERTLRANTRFHGESVFMALQDITALRTAEREVLRYAGILEATLEATADGIMVFSPKEHRILASNRRFREIFGAESAGAGADNRELLELVLPQLKHPEEFLRSVEELLRRPEDELFGSIELKDGRIFERYTAPVYFGGDPIARIVSYRDATERVRAHEELLSRERHLALSQEIANIGSFEWDLDAGTVTWSDGMFRVYGVPRREGPLPHDFGTQYRHPDDRDLTLRAMNLIARGERKGELKYRIVRPGGEIRWLYARGEVLERDGRRTLVGVVRDVTENYMDRQAVKEAEERFRATFEQAAVGIAHLTPGGHFARMNDRLTQILLRSREEIGRTSIHDLIWSEDLPEAEEMLGAVRDGHTRSESRELRLLRSDGEPVWVELTISAVRSAGDAFYILAVVQDISARKRVEKDRQELTRNVRLLLESTSAGLFAVDRRGICTMINQAACRMLGYDEPELLGRRIHDLVHDPADRDDCLISGNVSVESESRIYNFQFARKDGRLLPCDVLVSPIAEKGERVGVAVSFIDISERRLLEAQLERSGRLASLGRLSATIAHEMNNVLMGILPFAEVVARQPDASLARSGEQIRKSVQRGKRVTQEILRFARPAEPLAHPLEVGAWLRAVGDELEAIVRRVTELEIDTPEQPLWVRADPDQLGQVLTNLIVNAVDAVSDSSDEPRISIATATVQGGQMFPFGRVPSDKREYVQVTLRDNGRGMAPDVLQHVFEPFFTTKRGGTGLGLAIAHNAVAAHGGALLAESSPGGGTAFHIFLPRIDVPAPQKPLPLEGTSDAGMDLRLLLVEDDVSVAEGLMVALEMEGAEVRLAPTGAEALAELEKELPDAVILDVGLPDMDGAEVCRRIAERWPNLPVLFSTGHGDASRLEELLAAKHRSFLMKPYSSEELRAALGRILDAG